MGLIRLTMSQALLKFIESQYVSHDGIEEKFVEGMFGIFGHGCVCGIGQALAQGGHQLRFYQGKNEQGMAHAAIAYAKQHNRRRIIACTSSIGPGAMNLIPAAATATANHIPLLLLPGDVFASRQPDPVLQQLEFPDSLARTANDAFKAVCRYWDCIQRPEQLMSAAINAFRVLTDPADTGAVCLSLPQDVEGEAHDYPDFFFRKRIWFIDRPVPPDSTLERAADAIRNSARPLLICGGGVRYAEAWTALAEFAERFRVPIGETQSGKGVIPWNHPCNMGGIGLTGTSAANILAQQADLVIGVGTRFMDFTTCSKWLFQNPAVRFVSINAARLDACKLDALPVVGDAREALQGISARLEEAGYRSGYPDDELQNTYAEWKAENDALYARKLPDGKLAASRVLGILNGFMRPDDVILTAGGSLPSDLQRLWRSSVPGTYHVEYGFSCMGYEVCGTIGCKLAIGPEREVYSVAGDGSYLMLHSELMTAVQEGLKVNICVFDNSGWGCIENLQNSQGTPTFGTAFRSRNPETGFLDGPAVPVDFAKNAESYGAVGYRVTTEAELLAALEDSRQQTRPCVFDIKVAPGTMTHGYHAWWRVGVAEVSTSESVARAYEEMQQNIRKARPY